MTPDPGTVTPDPGTATPDPGTALATRAGPRVVPVGDLAFLAILGETVEEDLGRRAHGLAERIRRAKAAGAGWGTPVPGYASVLAPFDPDRLDPDAAMADLDTWLRDALAGDPPPDPDLPMVEVPVRYGGDDGPDLPEVADRLGMTPEEVISAHAAVTYRVSLLGFVPGFAYLGPLPEALVVPRRAEPRPRVPAGSVAIAGRQTAVYPFATPGGWQLIGRTDLPVWDLRRSPPSLLQAGGRVRFVPARG